MRIALLIGSLSAGGAERVAANLANGLQSLGHQVLLLTYQKDWPDQYTLNDGIIRDYVDFTGGGVAKIRNLREKFSGFRAERVISFINKTNVRAILAGRGQAWKTIVTEHNFPPLQPIEPQWELMRRISYRWAWKVVSVSKGVDGYFSFLPARKRFVVPNAFPPHSYSHSEERSRTIIAVGRLVQVKGFDLLIEAFAKIVSAAPGWKLEIWGEGNQESALRERIQQKDLGGRVFLKGLTADPLKEMSKAEFLVCSSRSEGFGNVLVEAMSVGIPVISFDCPSGPRDIVVSGETGYLVPNGDVDALAGAMQRLLEKEEERSVMGKKALEFSRQYANGEVLKTWVRLLEVPEESKLESEA
jgi:glycosyltransferase involved in cell wall biosynthesis